MFDFLNLFFFGGCGGEDTRVLNSGIILAGKMLHLLRNESSPLIFKRKFLLHFLGKISFPEMEFS
jgi:hypothetical protein